jgi:NitT/TauT family transport system ATP-binding protein
VRVDPQAPDAYGATITYDLPVRRRDRQTYNELSAEVRTLTPLSRGADVLEETP